MKVRCLHTLAEIVPLRDAINSLNLASGTPDPFSTFEFYENLIVHGRLAANNGTRVWFLAAFRDENLVGYMALKEKRNRSFLGLNVVTLCFLTEHDADRPHPVAEPDDIGEVVAAFYAYLNGRRDWHYIELQQQDARSPLYPLPRGIRMRGCWVKDWPTMDNYTIHFKWRTLAEYFTALPKKVRADLKRGIKRLSAAGRLELLSSADPKSTPTLLDLYYCIEQHSWKTSANLSLGNEPVRAHCIRGLLDPHHPLQMIVHILLLNDVPIAGMITGGFTAPSWKGLYGMHIVFDDRCMAAAPGSALLLLVNRYAIHGGYHFLNLLSGFGHYKSRWLAQGSATRSAQIYRIGALPFWKRLFGEARRWTLTRLSRGERVTDVSRPRFNPSRREVIEHEASRAIHLETSAQERERFEILIASARRGQCEFLSTADVVKAMPFPVILSDKDTTIPAIRNAASTQSCGDASTTKWNHPSVSQREYHDAAQTEQLAH